MTAQEFLRKSVELKGRVVSSGDLHTGVITEAQANNKFWVDPETGFGWAIIPWTFSTIKDREREGEIFKERVYKIIDNQKAEADAEVFSTEDSPNFGAIWALEQIEEEIAQA